MIGIFSAKYQEEEEEDAEEEEEFTPTFIEGAEMCARHLKAESWGEPESSLGLPAYAVCAYCKMNR